MWRGAVIKNRFFDTDVLWIIITATLAVVAPTFHFLAIRFDLYGNPPHPDLRIDVYTHSVSSIAVIAVLFNFNLTRNRWYYWGIPILAAFAIGLIWEIFEEVVIRLQIINFYNSFWNAVQDLYLDTLGGITAGFLVDKVID